MVIIMIIWFVSLIILGIIYSERFINKKYFWICFSIGVFNIILNFAFLIITTKLPKNIPVANVFSIGIVIFFYSLFSFILIVIFYIFKIRLSDFISLNIVLFMIASFILGLLIIIGKIYTQSEVEQTEITKSFFEGLLILIDEIINITDKTDKYIIQKLLQLKDKIRFSDPVSIPIVKELEDQIREKLNILKMECSKTNNSENILREIDSLNNLFDKRNSIIKIHKKR